MTPTFRHYLTGQELPDRRQALADRRCYRLSPAEGSNTDAQPHRSHNDRRYMRASDLFVVVVKTGHRRFGLLVDELLNTEEIVVKPLPPHIKGCRHFSGTTITGEGRVAMILSTGGLSSLAQLRFTEIGAEERRRQEEAKRDVRHDHSPSRQVVIFNYDLDEYFAVPVGMVARLEKIDPRMINRIGHREFINYRLAGLPLVRLDQYLPVSPLPESLSELFIIVPRTTQPLAGLLASRVLDVIETVAEVKPDRFRKPGLVGSALVEGRLTMFIDTEELLTVSANDGRSGELDGGTT